MSDIGDCRKHDKTAGEGIIASAVSGSVQKADLI